MTGWWFQTFFIFTRIWGRFPFWPIFFKWVETTNLMIFWSLGVVFLATLELSHVRFFPENWGPGARFFLHLMWSLCPTWSVHIPVHESRSGRPLNHHKYVWERTDSPALGLVKLLHEIHEKDKMDAKHPPRGLPESFLFSRKWPTLQKSTWLNLGFIHFLTPHAHSWESRRVIYTWWIFPPSKTGNLDTCPPRCSDLFIPKKQRPNDDFKSVGPPRLKKKERSSSMNVTMFFLGVLLSPENSTSEKWMVAR